MSINPSSLGANSRRREPFVYVIIVVLALVALVSTYVLSTSNIDGSTKTRLFWGVIAAFFAMSVSLHIWRTRRVGPKTMESSAADPYEKLLIFDEAREYFAGSLRTADTFRFVADRLKELIPFDGLTLYAFDPDRENLRVAANQGKVVTEANGHSPIVRECLRFGHMQISPNGIPSIAVPFTRENVVVAVMRFHFAVHFDVTSVSMELLACIAGRVGPLVISSLAFERSHAKALTDSITDVPNERAFFQVLETQIAESKRHPDHRPLSILAIDIKGFDELNQRFGHAAGDRVLEFVAKAMRDNLRLMDFFARSGADEFLIVTPTAPAEIAHEIIARLQTTVFGRKLAVTGSDAIEVTLNFGSASIGTDGETPDALLKAARLRKEQAKSPIPSKVLWFPQEFAN